MDEDNADDDDAVQHLQSVNWMGSVEMFTIPLRAVQTIANRFAIQKTSKIDGSPQVSKVTEFYSELVQIQKIYDRESK